MRAQSTIVNHFLNARLFDFLRIWASTYPNDFEAKSRTLILNTLVQESPGNRTAANEFKLLFLKTNRKVSASQKALSYNETRNSIRSNPLISPRKILDKRRSGIIASLPKQAVNTDEAEKPRKSKSFQLDSSNSKQKNDASLDRDKIKLDREKLKTLRKLRSQKNNKYQTTSLVSPRHKNWDSASSKRKFLLDFSSNSIAKELTMIEWEIFKEIAPREFLNKAWQRENNKLIAPNIIKMINRFNEVSYWVATEILTKNKKTQVKVIKKFIKIAYLCLHFGNFNSMMEILSGLNSNSISRLKVTLRTSDND